LLARAGILLSLAGLSLLSALPRLRILCAFALLPLALDVAFSRSAAIVGIL
jgi:hypothetical protein